MRKLFYIAVISFIFFEFFKRYLVMPMIGSQDIHNISIAYYLHFYKRIIEFMLLVPICYCSWNILQDKKKIFPILFLLMATIIFCFTNYMFVASSIFLQPKHLIFRSANDNKVAEDMMIIGVTYKGLSKAYPESFTDYHHQIVDSIGDKKIIITFCGLCRSGRVFEPYVDGEYTLFRLVGVHHRNALLEDDKTKSWWSQETGICIAGKQKGKSLPEYHSQSMTLKTWLSLYPTSQIMQADPSFLKRYPLADNYKINAENPLIQTAGGLWSEHSFVIGLSKEKDALAIEWNNLLANPLIQGQLANTPFILALSSDKKSFVAYENPLHYKASLYKDTLFINNIPYALNGKSYLANKDELKIMSVYREYWFSWLYSHPNTKKWIP